MAVAAEALSQSFSVGKVVRTILEVLSRNIISFLFLAFIASVPWAYISTIREASASSPGYVTTIIASLVAAVVLSTLLQASLTYATIVDLNGERPSLGRAIWVGIKSFFPLVLLGLLVVICIGFAALLLIVPGIMLAMTWSVAVPVYVGEQNGVFDALARSAELTKGYRWKIFALWAIYFALVWALAIAVEIAKLSLNSVAYAASFLQLVYQMILLAISTTGYAVIFQELRIIKDGVSPQQLASVFD